MTIPGYLDDTTTALPVANRPVYWNTGHSIDTNVRVLEAWIQDYSRLLPPGAHIDEAAILVPTEWHSRNFIGKMEGAGWEHFNGADDLVYTNPFSTRYFVHYEFLRSPEKDYRIEVMTMSEGVMDHNSGFSPLHHALWYPNGKRKDALVEDSFPVPHLSFKVPPNVEKRPQAAYSRAVASLQAKGLIHAQTCQSTYGVFGYYLPNDANRQLYMKPRLNLRDAR